MSKFPNVWFTSDSHFGHKNMVMKFTMDDGRRVRHEFDSMEACDEFMIQAIQTTVPQGGKLYHLGDFSFSETVADQVLARLDVNLTLILGNHDIDDPSFWVEPLFSNSGEFVGLRRKVRKLLSWKQFGPTGERPLFVACHYPLHPMCITAHHDNGRVMACVHGHEHRTLVKATDETPRSFWYTIDSSGQKYDGRYINICVENTGYAPIHYDEIIDIMKERGFKV